MIQAVVKINERANRVLNIIKAKYGLRTKSEAINIMAENYESQLLEPELRPEYIKELRKIEKEGILSEEEFKKRLKVEF